MSDRLAETMTLSHYATHPLGMLRSVEQKVSDYKSCYDKPKGLWVSVDGDDDWKSWCESESFGLGHVRHRVTLAQPSSVLILSRVFELLEFQDKYSRPVGRWNEIYIDWVAVAKDYPGIIIAPYQWSCRMDMSWYYGWDCASGCIWNADAIASVEEIREAQAA